MRSGKLGQKHFSINLVCFDKNGSTVVGVDPKNILKIGCTLFWTSLSIKLVGSGPDQGVEVGEGDNTSWSCGSGRDEANRVEDYASVKDSNVVILVQRILNAWGTQFGKYGTRVQMPWGDVGDAKCVFECSTWRELASQRTREYTKSTAWKNIWRFFLVVCNIGKH